MILYLSPGVREPLIAETHSNLVVIAAYVCVAGGIASLQGPRITAISESEPVPMDEPTLADDAHYWSWTLHGHGDYKLYASPDVYLITLNGARDVTKLTLLKGGRGTSIEPSFSSFLPNYDPNAVYPKEEPATYESRWQQL